ncbi:uncharacterized protein EDB91DRAFT_1121874, partial [Suillus paluster]|uniref:uncharacterized protein n=1 Tax=Suillus paluster TaxID=48578 RepID=UPI001B873992
YKRCLDLEAQACMLEPALTHARLLGFMLIYAPSAPGRDNIVSEIIGCKDVDALSGLGLSYFNHFLHLFVYSEESEESKNSPFKRTVSTR